MRLVHIKKLIHSCSLVTRFPILPYSALVPSILQKKIDDPWC